MVVRDFGMRRAERSDGATRGQSEIFATEVAQRRTGIGTVRVSEKNLHTFWSAANERVEVFCQRGSHILVGLLFVFGEPIKFVQFCSRLSTDKRVDKNRLFGQLRLTEERAREEQEEQEE